MSKFISTCCVCGTITGVTTVKDGSDKERVSHGYCGKGCAQQTPVQVMLWDDKLGCRTADAGNMTSDGRIFYHMKALDTLVRINKKDRRVEDMFWNGVMYEIAEYTDFTTPEHGNRVLKDAIKEGSIAVI